MFGFRYAKFSPSSYVLHFANGKVVREGAGLSFFYFGPSSSIVLVPMASVGVPFAFSENTADFQTVTIQGQLTYRVVDHKKLARMMDFTVGPNGKYLTDDFQKLPERLINEIQPLVRAELQRLPLRRALVSAEAASSAVLANLRAAPAVVELGLEPLGLNIQSIRPNPELATALEAEAREELQRKADEAIYARRKASVEQERTIKESEFQTEFMVHEQKTGLRERWIRDEIALEEQRAGLTEKKLANERKEADGRAYAIEAMMKPLEGKDPRVLMMLQGGDPKAMIAMAFQELASNAQKIGELNISPDLLQSLLSGSAVTNNKK